ncbi:MAG: response regulator [Planctomycetota bacterium]|nr:response regulator [Planctomycetota bacterium]
MEILLVAEDRLVRDQVKVGLQQFPEFSVTTGEGYAAINEARQREFDCVFLGVDFAGTDGFRLLEHIRSFDAEVYVVAITSRDRIRELQAEKSRLNLTAILGTPIDASEFFRLVGMLRSRRLESKTAR